MSEKTDQDGGSDDSLSYYAARWYFDFLPKETRSLDEMILAFETELDKLREMRATRVESAEVVYRNVPAEFTDYVVLFTTDRAVAEQCNFDMEPIDESDWDDYVNLP